MITKEFVQKYLDIKERYEYESITDVRYTVMLAELCRKHNVSRETLIQYNMDVDPSKIVTKGKKRKKYEDES